MFLVCSCWWFAIACYSFAMLLLIMFEILFTTSFMIFLSFATVVSGCFLLSLLLVCDFVVQFAG